MSSITIVGLGPGDARLLTREAWEVLVSAESLHLRTARHPAVADLPPGVVQHSFDHLYDSADAFQQVYAAIVATLLAEAQQRDVVYAVPGHPFVGETTVTMLVTQARDAGIPVRIVDGLSFIEPTLAAVGADGIDGVQLFDALEIAGTTYLPINANYPLLLSQVYSRMVAGDVKLALMAAYADEHEVALVHGAGTGSAAVEWLPLHAIDHSRQIAHMTSLYVPPRRDVAALPGFAESIAVLRGPNGCPWDREQTPQSLRAGFLEEVAEALDAIDRDDVDALAEELGDVLLHIVMQAQMAAEDGYFTLTDVIAGIDAKIKRRHPHVWGDVALTSSGDVVDNWAAIKAREKAGNQSRSMLDNIPYALPALARSQKIQSRVRKIGFDWPTIDGVWAKLDEEIGELRAAATDAERSAELGDLLFVVVNLAKWLEIDAETALREANAKFERRFSQVEALMQARGRQFDEMNLDMLEALWQEAKALVG